MGFVSGRCNTRCNVTHVKHVTILLTHPAGAAGICTSISLPEHQVFPAVLNPTVAETCVQGCSNKLASTMFETQIMS